VKIDINQIIQDSGENLTKLDLAKEAFRKGVFKSQKSAINMLNYNIKGRAKSLDDQLLSFLAGRFGYTDCEFYCKYCKSK
jgi:hypothetical protein